MSFLDTLKQQAAQAAGSTPAHPAQGRPPTGNPSWDVTFPRLPVNLEQMRALGQASLKQPQDVAALTVAALCIYPVDPRASTEMLNFLRGPRPLSNYDLQFLADRFRGKDYVPSSYFRGATPQNNYEPSIPYTITVQENPYSRSNIGQGYLTLHLQSGGADSLRPITLRQKASTGEWFLWEQSLLGDIRPPASADPWA